MSFKYAIRINDEELKKKQSTVVVDLPKDLKCTPGNTSSWFDHNKDWFALSVYDKQTGAIVNVDKNMKMSMEFTFFSADEKITEPFIFSLQTKRKGKPIFWFASIDMYIFGEMTMKFSTVTKFKGEEIEPLVHKFSVKFDIFGKKFTESELVMKGGEYVETPDQDVNDSSDKPKSSGKKRTLSEAKGNSSKAPKTETVRSKAALIAPFVSAADHVLNMPPPHQCSSFRIRLERTVDTANYNSRQSGIDAKNGRWTINGPVLVANLSSYLTTVVRDDKAQVEAYSSLLQLGFDVRHIETARSNAQRPTTNELFLRLQNKISHIPESVKVVQHLRDCFEGMFENNILYCEEKRLFKDKLSQIKSSSSSKFADSFGPSYFLRFILFFVVGADGATYDEANSTSATQRRNAMSNRQGKQAFGKLQEIIDLAIKDLDDGAHHYFC